MSRAKQAKEAEKNSINKQLVVADICFAICINYQQYIVRARARARTHHFNENHVYIVIYPQILFAGFVHESSN